MIFFFVTANRAPVITQPAGDSIQATVNQLMSLTISATDSAGETLTIRASVENSAAEEQLVDTELVVVGTSSGDGVSYTATLDWTPSAPDTYTVEITVTDSKDSATTIKPLLIFCACENEGNCDNDVLMVKYNSIHSLMRFV